MINKLFVRKQSVVKQITLQNFDDLLSKVNEAADALSSTLENGGGKKIRKCFEKGKGKDDDKMAKARLAKPN